MFIRHRETGEERQVHCIFELHPPFPRECLLWNLIQDDDGKIIAASNPNTGEYIDAHPEACWCLSIPPLDGGPKCMLIRPSDDEWILIPETENEYDGLVDHGFNSEPPIDAALPA